MLPSLGLPLPRQLRSQGTDTASPQGQQYILRLQHIRQHARNFLHIDIWQQWIDEGNAQELNRGVTTKIEEANALLDRVGRPFGYRVSRAISAYVRQHPEDNWEIALADQIEQRIMPKLRGIDLHDADTLPVLKGFETMARDLNDDGLEEAIRKGSDTNSSLFVWRGVERTPSER